jgi:hypothetical protein
MNAEKLDRSIAIAANLAYLLVVIAVLVLLFPGLRRRARLLVQALIWNYQLGVYLSRQQPVPGYVKDALAGKVADVDEHGAPSSE